MEQELPYPRIPSIPLKRQKPKQIKKLFSKMLRMAGSGKVTRFDKMADFASAEQKCYSIERIHRSTYGLVGW